MKTKSFVPEAVHLPVGVNYINSFGLIFVVFPIDLNDNVVEMLNVLDCLVKKHSFIYKLIKRKYTANISNMAEPSIYFISI